MIMDTNLESCRRKNLIITAISMVYHHKIKEHTHAYTYLEIHPDRVTNRKENKEGGKRGQKEEGH